MAGIPQQDFLVACPWMYLALKSNPIQWCARLIWTNASKCSHQRTKRNDDMTLPWDCAAWGKSFTAWEGLQKTTRFIIHARLATVHIKWVHRTSYLAKTLAAWCGMKEYWTWVSNSYGAIPLRSPFLLNISLVLTARDFAQIQPITGSKLSGCLCSGAWFK